VCRDLETAFREGAFFRQGLDFPELPSRAHGKNSMHIPGATRGRKQFDVLAPPQDVTSQGSLPFAQRPPEYPRPRRTALTSTSTITPALSSVGGGGTAVPPPPPNAPRPASRGVQVPSRVVLPWTPARIHRRWNGPAS